MKLRLRENSVRLRLLRSEIEQLSNCGIVSEKIQFGQFRALIYSLKISDGAKEIFANFVGDEINIEIPADQADEWRKSERVGLRAEQNVDGNLTLLITIEKDFVCPERPADADNADAFPHPKMNC